MTVTAFAADNDFCTAANCQGTYENGFCSLENTHYEEPPAVNGVYQISNAGQLYWFANYVNSGAADADAVLMDDITVNSGVLVNGGLNTEAMTSFRPWNPIGYYNKSNDCLSYTGSFDGKGHTISGLYHSSSKDRVGLFGAVENNASIKNVGVVDSYIHGDEFVGGVVGRNADSAIENCWNAGVVVGSNNNVAGVCASNSNGTVKNCYNTGSVSGKGLVGGVVGSSSGTVSGCYNTGDVTASDAKLGGVVGNSNYYSANTYVYITDCYNTGTVTGAADAGGVAGYINYTSVQNCYNTGNVIVTGTTGLDDAAGGVVGESYTASRITNCYNTGAVTSNVKYVGGVVGNNWTGANGILSNCYNTGTVTGTAGTVSGSGTYVGGVAGKNLDSTISSCYYLTGCASDGSNTKQTGIGAGTTGTTAAESGTAARSAEQFASGEVAYTMNGSASTGSSLVWYQNIDVKDAAPDASPVLDSTHGTVYHGYKNCTEIGYTNNADYGDPGDHAYGDPVFSWNEKGTAAKAVFTCTACAEGTEGHTYTVDAVVGDKPVSVPGDCRNPGTITYSATVTVNGQEYTDEKTVEGVLGDHADDENKDHKCDLCGEVLSECIDKNGDYKCDICGAELEKPTDPDDNDPKPSEPEEDEPKYEAPECPKDATCVLSQFSDVKIDDWYHDGVHFCVDHGIVNGMGNGTFAPNDPTTRAQLVTMLYRLEGEPSIEGLAEPFTDVSENDWFYAPIVWAYNNKVVNGMTETTFAPDAKITREQVATILHRYLGTPAGSGDLSGYPDADKVQDYAKDALTWAVGEGLINGVAQTDGTSLLAPDGNATRAQIATILMRYLTA